MYVALGKWELKKLTLVGFKVMPGLSPAPTMMSSMFKALAFTLTRTCSIYICVVLNYNLYRYIVSVALTSISTWSDLMAGFSTSSTTLRCSVIPALVLGVPDKITAFILPII